MKIGSHVGMSGKEMLLGSAKEAVSYGAVWSSGLRSARARALFH